MAAGHGPPAWCGHGDVYLMFLMTWGEGKVRSVIWGVGLAGGGRTNAGGRLDLQLEMQA